MKVVLGVSDIVALDTGHLIAAYVRYNRSGEEKASGTVFCKQP